MTPSQMFEGENSSLRKTFEEAVNNPAHEWRENYNEFVKDVREYGDFPESLASHVEKFIEHTLTTHSAHLVERIEALKKNCEACGEPHDYVEHNQALDQAIGIIKSN